MQSNRTQADLPTHVHRPTLTAPLILRILTGFHAGYFRISLALCSQAVLWNTFGKPATVDAAHDFRRMLPPIAFTLLWSFALLTLLSLSLLYLLRCFLLFDKVKDEFVHHVGVNYMFAPWISWLFLLRSSPVVAPKTVSYLALWWVFVVPIFALDVKIYGEWFTKGERFLSSVANPTSHLSVIANLVGSRQAALMGWTESAVFMFSLGMIHYLVLFVTLYQRLSGNSCPPAMLRPVLFLFFAAPSMASLAWGSIAGTFDTSSKMLFFLSLFLFMSLVSRPALFKKSLSKYSVTWWAYSFPLTVLAIASTEYAQEVKSSVAHGIMLSLSALSVLVCLGLMVFTALNTIMILPGCSDDPIPTPTPTPTVDHAVEISLNIACCL